MKSEVLFAEAQNYLPGGVNSPVRAFRSVNGTPRFIERARAARIFDVDGNEYTDYIGSWGPMILGHNNEQVIDAVKQAIERGLSFGAATENELIMARLMCEMVPSLEMVRMTNSGTEAVMSALRLARGYTGRDKIVKFAGCYHGHCDAMLVKAGSGALTTGVPDSLGVPRGCAEDTLTASYNDLDSVNRLFEENRGQIAAIIVEPVAANMGVVLPAEGFLEGLRDICNREGTLLIFDEVITGFRLGASGAQGYYGVRPDLTTFGKIIGGGMPVGAYGGRREIMEMVAPLGGVYQAGTLSGNPVAMAAGIAQLSILKNNPDIYSRINTLGTRLFDGFRSLAWEFGAKISIHSVGSIGSVFFTPTAVYDYASAKASDVDAYARFFDHMLNRGQYIAPAQFEALFISAAHTEEDIDRTIEVAREYFAERR